MTNVGKDTLKDFYFGVNSDPDTPEQGWNEWTDDLSVLSLQMTQILQIKFLIQQMHIY